MKSHFNMRLININLGHLFLFVILILNSHFNTLPRLQSEEPAKKQGGVLSRPSAASQTHFILGKGYFSSGKYEKALDELDQALKSGKNDFELYQTRAAVYAKLNKPDEAIADYKKALELKPDDFGIITEICSGLIGMNKGSIAIELYSSEIKKKPEDARLYNNRGVAWKAENNLINAEADYTKAIQLDWKHASAYFNRGNIYREKKQFLSAISDYNAAILLEKNAEYFNNRGLVFYTIKIPKIALMDFNQSLHLNPDNSQALVNRGNTHSALGNGTDAINDFNRAISKDSSNHFAYYNLARQRINIRNGECLRLLDTVFKLKPDFYPAYRTRADYYYFSRDHVNAVKNLELYLKSCPDDPEANNQLAWIMAASPVDEARNGKLSIEHAKKACELSKWVEPMYLDTLAAAYAEAEDFEEAVKWQIKATSMVNGQNKVDFQTRVDLYKRKEPYTMESDE